MMDLGISYDDLTPIVGDLRAGVVQLDTSNPDHLKLLFEVAGHFLCAVAGVHGGTVSHENVSSLVKAFSADELEVSVLVGSKGPEFPLTIEGMATFVQTFGVEWDDESRMKIVPMIHGEDLSVNNEFAEYFRNMTRSGSYPNGRGLGTWFMFELLKHLIYDPHWVCAARDSEISSDNHKVKGMQQKIGAVHGSPEECAVLEYDPRTEYLGNITPVKVDKIYLPSDKLCLEDSHTNFMTHWSSENATSQIAVTFTKLPSVLDGHTVVWTRIQSHGPLPDGPMLKAILDSLFAEGRKEISDPERRWGMPDGLSELELELTKNLGWPAPLMHIHAYQEPEIIQALKEMGARGRVYADKELSAALIDMRNVPDPEQNLGQAVKEPTRIEGRVVGQNGGGLSYISNFDL